MSREYSGALTLLQIRARQAAVRTMLDIPKKGEPVNGGRHGPIPDAWAPGAPGWSGPRYLRVIRIPSLGEYRMEVDDRLKALEGKTVNGATLGSLGVKRTLAAILGRAEPVTDEDYEALEAAIEDTGE